MSELLQVQFQGVDEGSDPKALPPGSLLRARNCAMDKARRLVKRAGTDGLPQTVLSGSAISTGLRLITNGKSLGMTDGDSVWSYAESLASWSPVDKASPWEATKRAHVDSSRSVTDIDIAISGDLVVTLYASGGIFVRVNSLSTGEIVFPATATDAALISSERCPRVLISDGVAYLFYATTTSVKVAKLNLTTFALTVGASVTSTNAIAYGIFDAVIATPTAGVPTLYIVYELAAGVNRTRIASFTLSTLSAIATLDSLGTSLRCVSLHFGTLSQRLMLIYSSSTSVATNVTTCSPTLAAQVGPVTQESSVSDYAFIVEYDASNLICGWTRNSLTGDEADADRFRSQMHATTTLTLDASSRRTTFGVYYLTKPWSANGRWYVGAMTWAHCDAANSTAVIAQPSNVVLEIETSSTLAGAQDSVHVHAGTLQNQTGWFATGKGQTKPAVDDDGNVWLVAPYRNREPSGYTTSLIVVPVGWDLFRLTLSGGDTYRSATIGGSLLLAGAAPLWDDGASVMPYGFAVAPNIVGISAQAGGSMVAGLYSYVATYAWRDAKGVLHRSAPSAPVTGTTAGANLSLKIIVNTSSLSAKARKPTYLLAANPVFVELWRTTIGGVGDHYRLSFEPSYQVFVNDPRSNWVNLTDTKADANIAGATISVTLASQERLYTDLGELENEPPPSFITCTTHRGRLVGIWPDLRTVGFSKDSTLDTTIAPGFHESLTLAFARDKSALASLDDKLVVFGKDSIDVVFGDGPDAAGLNNTWQVQPVQSDVGCVNPRSIVAGPMGVVFESARGLDLLGRDMTISPIGKLAEDTLAAYPTITSAVLVAEEEEIRLTCVSEDGMTGVVLVWDYGYKFWFTRSYKDSSDTLAADIPFVDAALIDGVYTMLTAGGQVYRETDAHKLDGGVDFVARDVLTAPISPSGPLAWHRVKDLSLLGTSVTDHDLAISIARDYATSFEQTKTFLAQSDATAVGPLEKCRVTLKNQKCRAVQFRFQDTTPTAPGVLGTGDGPILEGFALRVAAKSGPAKTNAAEQG